MNTKTILISVAAVIILVLIGMRINRNLPQITSNNNPIIIGAVLSLSGDAAPWGEYAKHGIDLAVKTINAQGGINGRPVQVIYEDGKTDPKQVLSGYNKLVSIDHVQGVLGEVFDFTTQPLIPLAHIHKIALISGSNFRIAGGFELNDQSFVMMSDFNKVVGQLRDYLVTTKPAKVAVVHFKSALGGEIAKTIDGILKQSNRPGIVDETYNQIGNNDWKTTIIKLKNQGVSTVFMDMVGNDPLNFLKQSKLLGFKPVFITYNDTLDAFANESDKSLLEGVIILNWEIVTPQFAELYQKEYDMPATKSADKWFSALYVMAHGIANTSDSSQVANYIATHPISTPDGTIVFTPEHAVENTPTAVEIFKNGVLVPWKQ